MPRPAPRAVSAREAARQLGISASHAYDMIREGEIRAVRIGARWIVPISELERLAPPSCAADCACLCHRAA